MSTHDPRQLIEDVRNHLAARDRRLSFLFGAGTSSAINVAPVPLAGEKRKYEPLIPAIAGLTEICRIAVSGMGKDQAAAWDILTIQCLNGRATANVDNLLTRLRLKIDAIGEGEALLRLRHKELCAIEKTICTAMAKAVGPAEERIPAKTPHDEFASWVKKAKRAVPIEVFTTNYDILFERALESARVPVFDGFVGAHHPFFYPECLEDEELLPASNWIRLWKLHGSVNWLIEDRGKGKRIVRDRPRDSGELILPSLRKYGESRKQPYVAYMDRLSRILSSEHALLFTCGYSFGDEHINAIIYGALDNRCAANVIVLRFDDLNEKEELVEAALRRTNLTLIGPNGGVISGVWGLWQLTQPVDSKTCSFMDTGFDSNALPEDKGSPAAASDDLRGRVRLGDFNWFCRFINAMGPDVQ